MTTALPLLSLRLHGQFNVLFGGDTGRARLFLAQQTFLGGRTGSRRLDVIAMIAFVVTLNEAQNIFFLKQANNK